MNLVAIALFIIIGIILIRYKLVCEVSVDGESLGYISDKEKFEQSIDDIINKPEENKLYTTIAQMPEYKVTFVNKVETTKDEEILAQIEESSETTYKLYAVTVDGKEKETLANLEEAENLVKELTKKYEKTIKPKIGVTQVITTDNTKGVTTVKTAKANITKLLNDQEAKAKEKAEAEEAKTETTTTTTKVASLNGVTLSVKPVSGVITSRFGNRESIRSYGHTGLDIAAPKGTKIKAAAAGTVLFAGTSGGYGKVVKISHGNDIKTYYAHCSELYVKEGQKVNAGDVIAAVGSTGNSTGNHLHFEVIKNGVELDPQNYLYK